MPVKIEQPAPHRNASQIEVPACPHCGEPIAPRLRVAVESVRRAAKRPVLSELIHVCSDCQRLFVVSLRPEVGP